MSGRRLRRGLEAESLDVFARTYPEDLATFIDENPLGDAWMQQSFRADAVCKAG